MVTMSECFILHDVSTFADFFVPHGYKVNQIRPTTNGVVILIEEWNDLLQNVIPAIHERYLEFSFGKLDNIA